MPVDPAHPSRTSLEAAPDPAGIVAAEAAAALPDDVRGRLPVALRDAIACPASGGWTHRTWQLRLGPAAWAVRVYRPPVTGLPADRDAERRQQRIAHAAGLAPALLSSGPDLLITEWIDGVRLADLPSGQRRRHLPAIARAVRRLHALPSAGGRYDAVTRVRRMLQRCITLGVVAADAMRDLDAAARVLHGRTRHHVTCHNDLNPWNLFLATTGEVLLIDWEWAGRGDPGFDVANLAHALELDRRHARRFEYACGITPSASGSARIAEALERLVLLREHAWARLMVASGFGTAGIAAQRDRSAAALRRPQPR